MIGGEGTKSEASATVKNREKMDSIMRDGLLSRVRRSMASQTTTAEAGKGDGEAQGHRWGTREFYCCTSVSGSTRKTGRRSELIRQYYHVNPRIAT